MFNKDLSQLKIIDFGYATPIDETKTGETEDFLKRKLNGTA